MEIVTRTTLGERLYYVTYTTNGELFEETFTMWAYPNRVKAVLDFLEIRNGNGYKITSVKEKNLDTGKLKEIVF